MIIQEIDFYHEEFKVKNRYFAMRFASFLIFMLVFSLSFYSLMLSRDLSESKENYVLKEKEFLKVASALEKISSNQSPIDHGNVDQAIDINAIKNVMSGIKGFSKKNEVLWSKFILDSNHENDFIKIKEIKINGKDHDFSIEIESEKKESLDLFLSYFNLYNGLKIINSDKIKIQNSENKWIFYFKGEIKEEK